MAEKKTNAMRILDSYGITYTEHTYDYSDGILDGVSVARKVGEDPDHVFKTLVTRGDDRNYYVFVIPVAAKLDLKAAARSVDVKSIEMIPQKELFPLTGYVHGGCSPIGMKKKFRTVIDETALIIDTIIVSGGKLGFQIEVDPEALIRVTEAELAAITVS